MIDELGEPIDRPEDRHGLAAGVDDQLPAPPREVHEADDRDAQRLAGLGQARQQLELYDPLGFAGERGQAGLVPAVGFDSHLMWAVHDAPVQDQ